MVNLLTTQSLEQRYDIETITFSIAGTKCLECGQWRTTKNEAIHKMHILLTNSTKRIRNLIKKNVNHIV